jgi:hypothetical protein
MKILGMFLVLMITACSLPPKPAPAEREAINREMPLIVQYESKRNALKKAIALLAIRGVIDERTGAEVKQSMDIEHVYYEASLISLARGEMRDYRAYVAAADKELERTKSALTMRMEALSMR